MKRFFLLFLLLPVMAAAQAQKTRADLYTEIDTQLASGQSMTAATLRATLKNVVASAENVQNGLADVDLAALGALSGTGIVDRVGSGSFATRSWAQVWTSLMADPQAGTYQYSGVPFTIANNKRLLGRDTALPPFTAQEIALSSNLTLSSATLDLASALTFTGKTIAGGTFSSGAFNGTVGATTPNTGAFTTGGFSGNQSNGTGGTGTNTAGLTLAGGSGETGGGLIAITRNAANPFYIGSYASVLGGTSSDGLLYLGSGQSLYVYADGAEKARITSTGLNNTAIGATTPSTVAATTLTASGASIFSGLLSATSPGVAFSISGGGTSAQYQRFNTSGGNYFVGVENSAGSGLLPGVGAYGFAILSESNRNVGIGVGNTLVGLFSSSGLAVSASSGGSSFTSTGTGSTNQLIFVNGNGTVGSIVTNGSATAFNTSSDRRLKTNIRDFLNSSKVIESIKVREYDWKTGEKDAIGFVAQELYEAYPAAVTKGDDGKDVKQQWAVDYSKLVPVLVAEVQALRARVADLEKNQLRIPEFDHGALTQDNVPLHTK